MLTPEQWTLVLGGGMTTLTISAKMGLEMARTIKSDRAAARVRRNDGNPNAAALNADAGAQPVHFWLSEFADIQKQANEPLRVLLDQSLKNQQVVMNSQAMMHEAMTRLVTVIEERLPRR